MGGHEFRQPEIPPWRKVFQEFTLAGLDVFGASAGGQSAGGRGHIC